jgi:signal peptidase I
VLAVGVGMALWSAVPSLIGWEPTTVVTGSMEPQIMVGDVVVARGIDEADLRPGQVLLVDDPDTADTLRLHRLVERTETGLLVLKGDANAQNDSSPVAPTAVHGIGVLRVPYAGLPVVWARTGQWAHLASLAAAVALLVAMSTLDRPLRLGEARDDDPDPTDNAGERETVPVGGTRTLSAWLARVGVPAAVAAGLLSTPSTGAVLSDSTASPPSSWASAFYTCSGAVLATGPAVYYRFEEPNPGGTTAADSSGNGRTGTYASSVTSSTNEPCTSDGGRAIRLNGTTGAVYGPTSPVTPAPNTFTISIWFRTSQPQGKLIGFATSRTGQSSQYDRHLYVDTTGRLVFGVYPGQAVTVRSTGTVTDNQWHLATATLSSAGMRLYLDGVLAASGSTTTAESYSSAYLRIGYDNLAGWPNPPSGFFNGFLDDAAYWPAALTAAQVKAIYDSRS